MIRDALKRGTDFVSQHTRITLLVMVLLTAGIAAGIPQLDTGSQAGVDAENFEHLDAVQTTQYVEENYTRERPGANRTVQTVYVWQEGGNALSKSSLLEGLYYQREIGDNESVAATLHEDGVVGFENLVAARAAGEPSPDLSTQIEALESASESEVEQLVAATIAEDPRAGQFLPEDHGSESTASTDRRVLVTLDTDTPEEVRDEATAALYESAQERSDAGFFTVTAQANTDYLQHFYGQMVQLVVPIALLSILFVLAFSYRDLVDIVVGMTGVVLSIVWTFGIMGWLGVAAGSISIIPVVLITGLSIDFGFHVFNRYREQREAPGASGDRAGSDATRDGRGEADGIRRSMSRGSLLVATALVLVTLTAAIGFMANVANPVPVIRNLSISITLGVVSAFVIFLTAVPALKIGIDGTLERFGFDRRKQPLGHGRFLAPALERSVWLARRAAPVVLIVALVAGAAGGLAWTELDREQTDQGIGEVADWKQQLPAPIGWESHEIAERFSHVDGLYDAADESEAARSTILIRGDVTDDDALEDIQTGIDEIESEDEDFLIEGPNNQPVRSPVTAMRAVAEENETFAAAFEAADTNGDGVPDSDLASLYDAFYAADSQTASRTIERADGVSGSETTGGEYRSMLVTVLHDTDWTERRSAVATMEVGADAMGGDGRTAAVAGGTAVSNAVLDELTAGIVTTLLIALSAIVVTLTVAFRVMHGSATLGTVTAVPITLVVGLVIGGMYLLEIPLNLTTALLMSLVVGLGVDYNIHLGDRFADELREGRSVYDALRVAVTGTGGALLGSTLTSVGAFSTLVLVPNGQIQGFGTIVVIALLTAFAVSVVVLPSVLLLWHRYVPAEVSNPVVGREAMPQD